MRVFALLFSIVLLLSCRESSKLPDDLDYGKTENGVYTNNYFGMEVPIPANWIIQSEEQVDQLMNKNIKALQEKNNEDAPDVKKKPEKAVMLLAVFKYRMDSVISGYNPYFMIITEKLHALSGIETGVDYLENEKKLMKQARIGYYVNSDYSKRKIGNKEFDVLRFTRAVGEQMDVQRVYNVRIEKEYVLNVMISHASAEQEQELMDILQQIKFR